MLVLGTLIYLPLLYAFFELPKLIINGALAPDASAFPITVLGQPFGQVSYLFLLCLVLLALMLITAGMRYQLSVKKGVLGEIMLRRLRFDLFTHVLRFPLIHFRRISPGEVVTMATAEAEPLGRYMGVALANPALQGGTLVTALVFLFMQDWILGVAAISLFPVQAVIVPKLQRRMNDESRRRLANLRLFAGHISESIAAAREIHSHDTSIFERARASARLGVLFRIRRTLYKLGNAIIFLNTFFTQVTPFLFYLIGGYLVIIGDLTLGALVAVIAAYRETVQPWNELLENYQQLEDNRVKYAALVENFVPPGLRSLPDERQPAEGARRLAGTIEVSDVTLMEGDTRVIDDVSLTAAVPGRLAIVGPSGSGKSELAQLLCGLRRPTRGTIRIDGRDIAALHPEEIGHCIGYVDQDSHIFTGSWRENLVYGLQHRPVSVADHAGAAPAPDAAWLREAAEAGNSLADPAADWIHYPDLDISGRAALDKRISDIVRLVGLESDIMSIGIGSLPAARDEPALAAGLLAARRTLHERLREEGLLDSIEVFREDRFNAYATVGENFLYGRPTDETLDVYHIGADPYVLDVLERHDLLDWLVEIGRQTAVEVLEMFQDVASGDERLERLSLIRREDMPRFKTLLMRIERDGIGKQSTEERAMLLSLVFAQAPAHQRLGLIDEDVCARLVTARHSFRAGLPAALRDKVEFFDEGSVCGGITVQCNVLFGRIAKSQDRNAVDAIMREVIGTVGLSDTIMALGLNASVGSAGSRLSPPQRQQLALARCLVKKPSILIVNEAINALDHDEQETIRDRVVDFMEGHGLVWVDRDAAGLRRFDTVIAMRAGRTAADDRAAAVASLAATDAGDGADTAEDVMRILQSAPILEGVAPSTVKILAYAGDRQVYGANETIMREGDVGETCCFLLEGTAEVSVGNGAGGKVVARLGPGEVIGETALILDSPRSATVTAAGDLVILNLSRDLFCDLVRKDEHFGMAMMRTLAQRLVETTRARGGGTPN